MIGSNRAMVLRSRATAHPSSACRLAVLQVVPDNCAPSKALAETHMLLATCMCDSHICAIDTNNIKGRSVTPRLSAHS
jgi:hypothetical protein